MHQQEELGLQMRSWPHQLPKAQTFLSSLQRHSSWANFAQDNFTQNISCSRLSIS